MTLQEQMNLEEQYVMPTFARKEVEFVRGNGMYLEDASGKRYLDFLSGIGVCSLGHCHPAVVGALTSQAEKLIHVSNYFYIENRGQLAEKLSELLEREVPEGQRTAWKTFFANSGAEANECAIKLARLAARHRFEAEGKDPDTAPTLIITLVKSFHGRTLATLAATGQSRLHQGFEPLPEGFLPTPINDIEALRRLMETVGHSVCAIMMEPIQGESGVNLCTPEFLQEARRLSQEAHALLILDEVQCGIFRTGRPFAFQAAGVIPDVVTMAKGIASGMPAGACAARGAFGDVLQPGQHGSTFGGSNLAVTVALATVRELDRPEHCARIQQVGATFRGMLADLPAIQSVRGEGLMVGADLQEGLSAPDITEAVLKAGLVVNATGSSTLRFLPPLICEESHGREAAETLASVL